MHFISFIVPVFFVYLYNKSLGFIKCVTEPMSRTNSGICLIVKTPITLKRFTDQVSLDNGVPCLEAI